ncbi:hypothetical protein PG996_015906 [Apiospora saccharicola]|uniref:Uncharacterized protein n=1 Tax=Apiospora saccharicola TaxID=335842 RepID=A0ABR1TN45_9PEZI
MLQSFRRRLWFLRRWFAPRRGPDGEWNEVHLQISEWGLHIQKDVLHIPHKYGLFFPGPPELRTLEAVGFFLLLSGLAVTASMSPVLALVSRYDRHRLPLPWAFHIAVLEMMVGYFLICWVTICFSKKRSPDYKWPQSKKRVE